MLPGLMLAPGLIAGGADAAKIFASSTRGWIKSENATYATAVSGSGLTVTTNSSPNTIGQRISGIYQIWQAGIEFDTSSIGSGATVTSATLYMAESTDTSTTDFDVEAYSYDWGAAVDSSDWRTDAQLGALTRVALLNSANFAGSTPAAFTSDAAFPGEINTTGTTKIWLASARNRSATTPPDAEWMQLFTTTAGSSRPYLLVAYE